MARDVEFLVRFVRETDDAEKFGHGDRLEFEGRNLVVTRVDRPDYGAPERVTLGQWEPWMADNPEHAEDGSRRCPTCGWPEFARVPRPPRDGSHRPWTVRATATRTPSNLTVGWKREREGTFATLPDALDAVVDLAESVAQSGASAGNVQLWHYDAQLLSVPLWRHSLTGGEAIDRLEAICDAAETLFGHMDRKDTFIRAEGVSAFDPPPDWADPVTGKRKEGPPKADSTA